MKTNDHMHFIDKPEDITPDKLRFMRHSLKSTGCDYEAKVLCWVADLLEHTEEAKKGTTEKTNE